MEPMFGCICFPHLKDKLSSVNRVHVELPDVQIHIHIHIYPIYMEQQTTKVRGWVSQPAERGTMDIIWSCASTVFLCTWVMLHLNVPAKQDSEIRRMVRKSKWFVLALLAPEVIMLFAGGQWASAKRSCADMEAIGIHGWTMVHAFYADSGGFVFGSRDSPPFPVTARQLHFLIKTKVIEAPMITKEEIWDKSKADLFAKIIGGIQSTWFVLQVVGRAVERMPVTLLELSTLALICCTGTSLFFWFHKPLNVETSTFVHSDWTISELCDLGGEAAHGAWQYTPLDFADPLDYTSSRMPFSHVWGIKDRPLKRIPNDRDSLLHNWKVVVLLAIPTAAFGTSQLIAWNFIFPTRTEQLLWRYTCLGNGFVLGVGCALEVGAIIKSRYTVAGLNTFNNYKLRWPTNILFIVPGIFYVGARTIVIFEVFISLRALPDGCFFNINWTAFLPHV